jgi:hypothetical protein
MIVVYGHGVNRDALRLRFAEGGYESHETPHYLVYELKPLGLNRESRDFGTNLAGVVGSFCTNYAWGAWQDYGAKTL